MSQTVTRKASLAELRNISEFEINEIRRKHHASGKANFMAYCMKTIRDNIAGVYGRFFNSNFGSLAMRQRAANGIAPSCNLCCPICGA